MHLQKVRLSFEPEVLDTLSKAADVQGISVTKLIQHTLKEAAERALKEDTHEQHTQD